MEVMGRTKISESEYLIEKQEQIERGLRIRAIRENELQMNKAELGRVLGVSGQFLGLVEDGRGNLVYRGLKKLKDISGHSTDFILYGVDEGSIEDVNDLLEKYSERQIRSAFNTMKEIAIFVKGRKRRRRKDEMY